MKKINLNIKLKDNIGITPTEVKCPDCNKLFTINNKKNTSGLEVAKLWLQAIIERVLNSSKIDPNTNNLVVTKTSNIEVIRKYNKIINKLYECKNGVIELDDDDFKWLDDNFHKAELPINKDISDIIIMIDNAIISARIS